MNRYLLVVLLLTSSTLSFFCNVASANSVDTLTYYTIGKFSGGCGGSTSTQITCNGLTLSFEAQPSTTLSVPQLHTPILPTSGLGIFGLSGTQVGSPVSWSANFTLTAWVTFPPEKPHVSPQGSLTGTISYNATAVGNPIIITWPVVSLNSPLGGGGLCRGFGKSPVIVGSPAICIDLPDASNAFVFIFNTAANGRTILSGTSTPLTAKIGVLPEPTSFLLLGTGTMFLLATVLLRRYHADQGARARPGTA